MPHMFFAHDFPSKTGHVSIYLFTLAYTLAHIFFVSYSYICDITVCWYINSKLYNCLLTWSCLPNLMPACYCQPIIDI